MVIFVSTSFMKHHRCVTPFFNNIQRKIKFVKKNCRRANTPKGNMKILFKRMSNKKLSINDKNTPIQSQRTFFK